MKTADANDLVVAELKKSLHAICAMLLAQDDPEFPEEYRPSLTHALERERDRFARLELLAPHGYQLPAGEP